MPSSSIPTASMRRWRARAAPSSAAPTAAIPSPSRCPTAATKDRSGEMIEGLKELALDGLIGVGGDGSLDILRRLLAPTGLAFIGVPKTIDNDVANTERAIGYSTAVAIATEALDRLQPTGASHERVMVLEVMGRDAGHIAIAAGIAGGADVVLIPEIRWHLKHVVAHIAELRAAGRTSALVVVAEAAGNSDEAADADSDAPGHGVGEWLARRLSKATGAEARATVLGHVQRGAMPTAEDRLLACGVRRARRRSAGRRQGRPHGGVVEPPGDRRAAGKGGRPLAHRRSATARWCARRGRSASAWGTRLRSDSSPSTGERREAASLSVMLRLDHDV